jgi:hypothetical protein
MHRSYPIQLPRPAADAPAFERASESVHAGNFGVDAAPRDFAREHVRLTEVDTRSIPGNAGTVTLYLSPSPAALGYLVDVVSAEGENIASIAAETPAEALEAYKHPFARLDVPDVFSRANS